MLRESLDAVASDTEFARPDRQEWEPLLDSLCVVGVVVRLAILLEIKIPPDRVVQKGGYKSVDEAIRGITSKTRDLWMNRNPTRI
jgi:acyl carrier protein